MNEKRKKILPFPAPVPAKADYQRVKANYSVREIKQLFGLSERTIRRWTEAGIVHAATSGDDREYIYDFQALTQFRRARELRGQGLSVKQIEAELQGQMSLFQREGGQVVELEARRHEGRLREAAACRRRPDGKHEHACDGRQGSHGASSYAEVDAGFTWWGICNPEKTCYLASR